VTDDRLPAGDTSRLRGLSNAAVFISVIAAARRQRNRRTTRRVGARDHVRDAGDRCTLSGHDDVAHVRRIDGQREPTEPEQIGRADAIRSRVAHHDAEVFHGVDGRGSLGGDFGEHGEDQLTLVLGTREVAAPEMTSP
jgi:hypothetical protein